MLMILLRVISPDGSAEDQILSPNISQVNDQDGLGNFNYAGRFQLIIRFGV